MFYRLPWLFDMRNVTTLPDLPQNRIWEFLMQPLQRDTNSVSIIYGRANTDAVMLLYAVIMLTWH
jgi:hypothetical protein